MKDALDRHQRRSIHLKGYDYAQAGAYFITVVGQGRACLFGEVVGDEMRLNDAGRMVERWFGELNNKFRALETDEYVVMPNHCHGIVMIVGADLRVCPTVGEHVGSPLPTVVQWFKTMTTNAYIRGVKTMRWPPFPDRLWQRNYYEHIIRNEESLNRIKQYSADNPARWSSDRENPQAIALEQKDAWL